MKFARILFGYAIAIAGLSIALFGPLFWLFTPDPTLRVEPHVAPSPPRIAESIARKRAAPVVQPEPIAPSAGEPAALSAMNATPVALPEKQVSVALPVEPVAKKRVRIPRHPASHKPRPAVKRDARRFVRSPAGPVTTARTDVPY